MDPKARIATVSPAWYGDQFNKVLAEQYQLMFPTAHDPGVGLGGFVMCGGHGLNSRLWGAGLRESAGAGRGHRGRGIDSRR